MIDSPDDNAATSKEQEGKSTRESVSCFLFKFQAMIASPNDNAAPFRSRDRRGCRIGHNDNAAPAKAAAARSSEKEGQSTRESCSSF